MSTSCVKFKALISMSLCERERDRKVENVCVWERLKEWESDWVCYNVCASLCVCVCFFFLWNGCEQK